jgi:ATP-binding cassette subfamily B protein
MKKPISTTKDTLRFYWHHTKPYKGQLFIACLNVIQSTINTILTPLLIGLAIAKLGNPGSVGLSYEQIFGIITAWSIAAILINRISMSALNKLELGAQQKIYNHISTHLMNQSYDFHATHFGGALLNQATRLGQGYITFMDTVMLDGLRNMVIVFFSSIAVAFYDAVFALIMFSMSLVGLGATIWMTKRNYPYRRKSVAAGTRQTAYLADMISNVSTVKSFGAEPTEIKAFDGYVSDTANKVLHSWSLQVTAGNITTALAVSMNLVILGYGIYATQHGLISIGIFIAAQLYAVRITGSFWDLTRIIRTLEVVFADAHEMTEIMSIEPAVHDVAAAPDIHIEKASLEMRQVSFRYQDADDSDNVLSNFNLMVAPGERVGLVGHSGGGKTTITKLLLRFMDIQAGEILIDGQNIAKVSQQSLRHNIAYVPQEPLLFHRSLAENIGYGTVGATDKDIKNAARLAYADEFISRLPQGYETLVGERGVKLSGGQRQRIAIARAILKNAPILLLDEATSALDSESEKYIQTALHELMQNKTTIVIAHRLSTLQKLDRIIVLRGGKIVEQGSHKQLLKKDGVYAGLWAHQSGGFIEE